MAYYNLHKKGDSFYKDKFVSFMAGGTGGLVSVLLNNPIDVIKTQMQSLGGAERYKGTLDCAKIILRDEGVRGYYKGCTPRCFRVFFEMAFGFAIFEYLKDITY
jgi:solute carrier family 25 citrate transporter 1